MVVGIGIDVRWRTIIARMGPIQVKKVQELEEDEPTVDVNRA
jgi:hypothetical protein